MKELKMKKLLLILLLTLGLFVFSGCWAFMGPGLDNEPIVAENDETLAVVSEQIKEIFEQ
jgi:hypothetical protein